MKTKALNTSDQGKKDLAKSVGVLQDELEKEKNKANHMEVELVRIRKKNENLEEIDVRRNKEGSYSPKRNKDCHHWMKGYCRDEIVNLDMIRKRWE